MPWNVYPKPLKGHTYYYAQRSFREQQPTKDGKRAKSKVRTETVYLGTAESIVNRFKGSRAPVEVRHRDFGFVAAIYQSAVETGLADLLKTHIPGERFGIPRWLYFMLPIINRLQSATSKEQIRCKWAEYKKPPATVPAGVQSLRKQSRYGNYIHIECGTGEAVFPVTKEIEERLAQQRKRLGKNLLFANGPDANAPWIIEQYRGKDRIEDGFKLLKHPELIRWRPCRHWTDTKIRAFGFCCVMAMILMRVMERKTALAGLPMSPALIKEELTDLKEVVMFYEDHHADTQFTRQSTVQQRLWDTFGLTAIENQLARHEATR
jgi:hypothetical protein